MVEIKFYLAARYSRRDEINKCAVDLRRLGHIVDCRWLADYTGDLKEKADDMENSRDNIPDDGRIFAEHDVLDIQNCNVIISFTEQPRSTYGRGGRHVEFGLAYAWHKSLVVIGPRENIFHWLTPVKGYRDWKQFLQEFSFST